MYLPNVIFVVVCLGEMPNSSVNLMESLPSIQSKKMLACFADWLRNARHLAGKNGSEANASALCLFDKIREALTGCSEFVEESDAMEESEEFEMVEWS